MKRSNGSNNQDASRYGTSCILTRSGISPTHRAVYVSVVGKARQHATKQMGHHEIQMHGTGFFVPHPTEKPLRGESALTPPCE